jgi:N-acetylglutamate synthase-like GNAT family acetyltransferase
MIDFNIRPACESEFHVIKDLIHLTGINPMGLDWKRFIVAVNDENQVLGIGQVKPHGQDVFELASIAVYPEYRSQGIARAVIEHLLKDGPRPLYLTCISTLEPLYQKFGFQTISFDAMPRYFQRISKLANVVFTFANRDDRLLVMKLQ